MLTYAGLNFVNERKNNRVQIVFVALVRKMSNGVFLLLNKTHNMRSEYNIFISEAKRVFQSKRPFEATRKFFSVEKISLGKLGVEFLTQIKTPSYSIR